VGAYQMEFSQNNLHSTTMGILIKPAKKRARNFNCKIRSFWSIPLPSSPKNIRSPKRWYAPDLQASRFLMACKNTGSSDVIRNFEHSGQKNKIHDNCSSLLSLATLH
jgi:hypothetical protein